MIQEEFQRKHAISTVKSHAHQKGHEKIFVITEDFCYHWWELLNNAAFNGELTAPVRFEIKQFRNSIGWCVPWRSNVIHQPRRVRIGLHKNLHTYRKFLCVLSHEMVHQWEWEILHSWPAHTEHSKQFYSWRHKLKESINLPLRKSY